MLALPCCRRGGSVDWGGDTAGGAPATGLVGGERGSPAAAPPMARGEGGRARIMSTTVLAALGGGRRGARGGGLRRGGARLLRAAEMRPNTSGSDAGGRSAREGRGGCWGGASCRSSGSAEAPAPAGREGGGRPRCCAPPHWPGQGGPLRSPPTRRHSLALPAGGERRGGRYRIGSPP